MKKPVPAAILTETALLGCEAAAVISLRAARLASGGQAAREEAALMVREKFEAGWELTRLLWTGQMGWRPDQVMLGTLRFYRKGVAANRRRLAGRR